MAYCGMTAIGLEFLTKGHYINALADEETRRYITLDRTTMLDEVIELALGYEAIIKVE